MVCITNLVVTLFLLVGSPFGFSSGFSISSRDSKSSVLLSPSSLPETRSSSSSTEHSTNENDSTNTQFVVNSEELEHHKSLPTARHVPLDNASGTGSTSSNVKTVAVVKREVSSATDEARVNGMYDPGLMIMSKRSAAALNKLMLALRSFDEPSSSSSYESELGGSTKEVSDRFPKTGFRSGGSGLNFGSSQQYALQRRGQKDRKIYLRCYFNAVSCFRRRK